MDLFDVLSNDERILVCSYPDDSCIVTWNKSLTFQVWEVQERYGYSGDLTNWKEVNSWTADEVPTNFEIARQEAKRWWDRRVSDWLENMDPLGPMPKRRDDKP